MPTWALYESKWDWKAFLAQTFETLVKNQATDLVIDLRGNEGGLGVGDVILSHLITKDLKEESITRRVRYQKVPDDLVPYLDTWDPSFKDWGKSAKDPKDGFYQLVRYGDESGSVIKPPWKTPRWAGTPRWRLSKPGRSGPLLHDFPADPAAGIRHLIRR